MRYDFDAKTQFQNQFDLCCSHIQHHQFLMIIDYRFWQKRKILKLINSFLVINKCWYHHPYIHEEQYPRRSYIHANNISTHLMKYIHISIFPKQMSTKNVYALLAWSGIMIAGLSTVIGATESNLKASILGNTYW